MSAKKKTARRKKVVVRKKVARKKKVASRNKLVVGKNVARKAGRNASPRRRGSLHLVQRKAARKRKPIPPAFPQTIGTSPKQQLLFDLVRSHTSVAAAIQGLLESSANRPLAEGKWSARETLLHLITRDRIRLREMERALLGILASWQLIGGAEQDEINARDLAALSHVGWDEAVRMFRETRRQLMEAIESVPEEPSEVWAAEHPFGWMMLRLPAHDRHHADAIKRSRS